MANLTFAQALVQHRLVVAPILRNRGPVTWFAGQRSLDKNLTNVVLPEKRVEGKRSPIEAVRALFLKLGIEDVLDDHSESRYKKDEPPPIIIVLDKPAPEPEYQPKDDLDITEEDGRFVLRLPDGRVYQSKRRRDLVRRYRLITEKEEASEPTTDVAEPPTETESPVVSEGDEPEDTPPESVEQP